MISCLRKLLVVLLLPGNVWAQSPALPLTAQPPPASPHAVPGVTFSDVTPAAGLRGFQTVFGTAAKDYLIEATGAGCAWVDYDNDGWLDIYLVNGSTLEALQNAGKPKSKIQNPKSALFHNNQDGTFTDVTDKAGVANERWGQGVCAGDFDNDGWADLYVTNFGANRLYRNNGDGTFTDIAEKAGVTVGSWSTGCAFGDYDGDGRLDLFVAGYVAFDLNNLPPAATEEGEKGRQGEGEKGKENPQSAIRNPQSNTPQSGVMGAVYVVGAAACQYRNQRVMCGPKGLPGAGDHLFRNNGDGTFTDTSVKAGVQDKAGYYGFGVAWFDADDDGKLDLLVANDSTPNYLYRNQGDGTFADVSYVSGAALNGNGREQAHMGVSIGDYDNDGRADIHITNFADDFNVLYHNDDGTLFSDVSFAVGLGQVTMPFLGWGTNFLDYDNDGWRDLFVVNGHIYPSAATADWGSSYQQRALLLRNVKGKFYDVAAGAALQVPRASRGSAEGDFDNDGDVDLLINNLDEPPTLLRNDGGNRAGHWLMLRLRGDVQQKTPRDAIGSVVFCTANGQRMRGEVASGRSLNSQSDLRVHFGLGAATKIDKLEVRWANGKTTAYEIKAVDQFVTIEQGKGIVP